MYKKYIYINDCIRWSGGINILIQLISTVKSSNQSNLETVYVKPSILTKFINFLRLLLRGGSYRTNKLIDDDLYIKFENFVKEEELEIAKYSYSEFKKLKVINYIFPVMKVNNSLKNKNLIGYIADCQHIHLPELFLRRTILYRNYQFKKVKKYCEKVMSTSDSVTHDLVKNYKFDFEKIFTIGFNPIRLEEDIEISKPDYDDYFLIANQLWEHKNHIYAIKAFKKYIKKLSFTHAYRSNFSLGNYTTNLSGQWDSEGNATETDIAGNFISQKQIMTMNILEQFAPLLGVDLTLSNNMSVKFEIKKDRNISLSLSNNQITEIKGSEIKFGSGYTWRKLSLPIKIAGKTLDPSDLRMRLDVAVRDNKTIIRKIVENQNQYTAGQTAVTIQFSGDYNLTKQLMLRIYFDRRVNTPHVSNSFPTANTNAGFALRFQLR